MHHRLIALPIAALASFAFASVALAGGWAQVTVKDAPIDPPAGGGTPIELNVLQHGVTPVSWPSLTVVATESASGAVVRAQAEAKGAEGSYVATIVFPSAGEWTLTFESAELEMAGSVAMKVAQTVAAPAAQPGAVASVTSTFDAMPLLLVLVAAAVALVVAGVFVRSGRASGATRMSART